MHTYVHYSTVYDSKDLEPTQMPINDRLDKKMWHIYIMEYYAAIKNDEFVSFVEIWMNLETIILSKMTRTENQTPYVFSHRRVMNIEKTWERGREQHSQG